MPWYGWKIAELLLNNNHCIWWQIVKFRYNYIRGIDFELFLRFCDCMFELLQQCWLICILLCILKELCAVYSVKSVTQINYFYMSIQMIYKSTLFVTFIR
jgi:hypothetical protein